MRATTQRAARGQTKGSAPSSRTASKATAVPDIPYEPETWNAAQLHAHRATTMEGAFHAASCLCSGWYRRAVTIDYQVTKDNDERYMIRPSDVPVLAGWRPVYELKAVRDIA